MPINSFEDVLQQLNSQKKKASENIEIPDISKLIEDSMRSGEELVSKAKENRWPLIGLALGLGLVIGYRLTSRKRA